MSYFGPNATHHNTYANTPADDHSNGKSTYIHVQYLEFENTHPKKEVMKLEVQLQTSKWV